MPKFDKISDKLKFKTTLMIEHPIPVVVDKARKLLQAIEKDLNDPNIILPPEARTAAEELARDLFSYMNDWISRGQKDIGPDGPQYFAEKCAKSINCQRIAIEAASGFSSKSGFSNFFRIVGNALISAINSCIENKEDHIKPWKLETTAMHERTSKYRAALESYREETSRFKDKDVQVENDVNLDYYNKLQ